MKPIAIIFSDLHIHDHARFSTRLDTSLRVLDKVSDLCVRYKVPAFHLGDLFHVPEYISVNLLSIIINKFNELAKKGWKLYCISGNHTIPSVSTIGNAPISYESCLSNLYDFVKCIDYKKVAIGGVRFWGIPYVDQNRGLSEYLSKIELNPKKKNVLLLHSSYPGARDTDGTVVESENINLNTLNRFDLTLMGHIHKPQRLSKKVYMIGAPYQQRRTDKDCSMGIWILGEDLSMEFMPLSNTYPRYIDVESKDDVVDDGNYYTVVAKVKEVPTTELKLEDGMSKQSIAKKYLRHISVKDKEKKKVVLDIIKMVDND